MAHRLSYAETCGIFQPKDRTHVPCTGGWILHCTTRSRVRFSGVLRIFTLLRSISRSFHLVTLSLDQHHPFLSFPKHLATTILASVSVHLTALDPPYKWNHILFTFWWWAYLTLCNVPQSSATSWHVSGLSCFFKAG